MGDVGVQLYRSIEGLSRSSDVHRFGHMKYLLASRLRRDIFDKATRLDWAIGIETGGLTSPDEVTMSLSCRSQKFCRACRGTILTSN
jgi:hypothetical protein